MFHTPILAATCQSERLHGGTLGTVKLVTGMAETAEGAVMPYQVVWKTQKKWERYGDPTSWRREYDLYMSDFQGLFTESFRWPVCYHAEMNREEDEIQLWMEYIDGISGLNLKGGMYEQAARELGRFQGRLYGRRTELSQKLANLSAADYAKKFYLHYRSWPVVYDYIRAENCEMPKHLREMLIGVDENAQAIFRRIEKLPVVLCHRDFWVANIFHTQEGTVAIDWDTAGWGYLGEDLASLLADEADVDHVAEYFGRCVPAYHKGFSEYAGIAPPADGCVWELTLLLFGYRLVEEYVTAEGTEDCQEAREQKDRSLRTLEKLYEIKSKTQNPC